MKFLAEDANASASIIDSFAEFSKTQYNDQTIYGLIPTMQFINQVNKIEYNNEIPFFACLKISNSNDRYNDIISSIPEYSSLFEKSFPLSSFPREHLLLLHKSVLHSSFIARYLLINYSFESQLEMWEYRISIDDKQIKDIDKLSPYVLVSSLYSRGLYLHLNDMGKVLENQQTIILNQTNKKAQQTNQQIQIDQNILNDWKQLLYQWITIHNKLQQLNKTSTSFLLHMSPLLSKQ